MAGVRVALARVYSFIEVQRTDASGVATFEGVVVGDEPGERGFLCSALADDGREGDAWLTVEKADPIAMIELHAPREIVVRVLDDGTGEPLPGAAAWVDSTSVYLPGYRLAPPVLPTDASGRTTLRLPEADVSISVQAPGYVGGWLGSWRNRVPLRRTSS